MKDKILKCQGFLSNAFSATKLQTMWYLSTVCQCNLFLVKSMQSEESTESTVPFSMQTTEHSTNNSLKSTSNSKYTKYNSLQSKAMVLRNI